MTRPVSGQRHDHNQPHPPERETILQAGVARERTSAVWHIVTGIESAMYGRPLDVPGLGAVLLPEYSVEVSYTFQHQSAAVALLASMDAGAPPPLPVAVPRAPAGESVIWIRTRRQWRALVTAYQHRKMAIHSRAAAILKEMNDTLDVIAGLTPVLDAEGATLTGEAALDAREARYRLYDRTINSEREAYVERFRTDPHPAAGTLATDVPIAREQHMDMLDAAAEEMRHWLLDGGATAANDAQGGALRLLESRRQAGRRALRAATTPATLLGAGVAARSLVRGVRIEDAPVWQLGAGTAISGEAHTTTYAAPAVGVWTLGLRAANPSPTAASKSAADLGDVVLDDADLPDGWAVSSAPAAHAQAVTIGRATGAGAPAAGSYTIPLTARNACGPRTLTVTITVPAAE